MISMFGRRPRAIPPSNVRLTREDGSVMPLEVVYNGWDRKRRVHVWEATAFVFIKLGDRIEMDELPGYTTVEVSMGMQVP